MRVAPFCTLAAAACLLVPALLAAQGAAAQTEANRLVAGGGITVSGWTGTTDKASDLLNTAKLAPEGPGMRVTTGPAVTYWNPANKATGDYTVKATFNEPKFMNLNDPSASLRDHDRGQRHGHAPAELPLLRGLRQRELHRPRASVRRRFR